MISKSKLYTPTSTRYPSLPSKYTLSQHHWLNWLTWIIVVVLFVVGMWMRLHLLNVPFDRDSYDEGVYWQSLRSMSTGASLYHHIFYSQPPFFLLSLYPIYTLLGQTIWSARLGIVIISLCGLLGALLLGKALAGRLGMLFALLLLVVNPLYLVESQTLQADAPSIALMLLGVGLAYLWWERPNGMVGCWLAMLAGITLALSMFTKLLVVPALVPVVLLALARLWQMKGYAPTKRWASLCPLLLGCIAFVVTLVLLLLPFSYTFAQCWQMVVTFHTDAKQYYLGTQTGNSAAIQHVVVSLLGACALCGTIIALLRRDWRVIPLLAWLCATIYLLWQEVPLFYHHMVALIPPLIALAVMAIAPGIAPAKRSSIFVNIVLLFTLALVLYQVGSNIQTIKSSYAHLNASAHAYATNFNLHVARDVQRVTKPDQLVITDAQFIVALADRSTPASMVDTSGVRIFTGYVTTQQLIEEASQPQVHAVLFYTRRLDIMQPSFYNWVRQHFHLAYRYGSRKELWVKAS